MNRVETSEATTSLGAEGAGPPVLATPPEPGVTWSVVLGVSEGRGGVGRATSLGGEEERRRVGLGDRDTGWGGGGGGSGTTQRRPGGGEELKWK